ncbi:hypothetical protein Dimus_014628 [Dionaea muscipula]
MEPDRFSGQNMKVESGRRGDGVGQTLPVDLTGQAPGARCTKAMRRRARPAHDVDAPPPNRPFSTGVDRRSIMSTYDLAPLLDRFCHYGFEFLSPSSSYRLFDANEGALAIYVDNLTFGSPGPFPQPAPSQNDPSSFDESDDDSIDDSDDSRSEDDSNDSSCSSESSPLQTRPRRPVHAPRSDGASSSFSLTPLPSLTMLLSHSFMSDLDHPLASDFEEAQNPANEEYYVDSVGLMQREIRVIFSIYRVLIGCCIRLQY